ncbi:MAG TPA: FAD-binding oxidoreductase [Chroococcales cyanobacterium]
MMDKSMMDKSITAERELVPAASRQSKPAFASELVNDIHSQLNRTTIKQRFTPESAEEIAEKIKQAQRSGDFISTACGRHAMGGQQFLTQGFLLDMTRMNRVIKFDTENGLVEAEAGIFWPDLIDSIKEIQRNLPNTQARPWVIAQKQTGGDRLSLGGALSANIHGRGLRKAPFVQDIEQFTLITAGGEIKTCSRTENSHLFKLAVGGYGLFGVVSSLTLRLIPQTTLRRSVTVCHARELMPLLQQRIRGGATYGDFQFAIDSTSADFLQRGILSTYAPTEGKPLAGEDDGAGKKLLSVEDWRRLLFLAHTDKTAAFRGYADHYLATDGQLYSSDTFQLATYIDGYHEAIDKHTRSKGSEMISELYVPRDCLTQFLKEAAPMLRRQEANVIYGTVRLIDQDNETFLRWAKQSWACIIFNLHFEHSASGVAKAGRSFRSLIDLAIKFGGSYYLTYHRFAEKAQLLACYPEMPEFIARKRELDPHGLFRSDWFDHYAAMFQS